MNGKISEFKKSIKGKNVAVIGIGVSNTPLIKYLSMNGAKITAFDKKEKEELGDLYNNLSSIGCSFSLGPQYLSNLIGYDIIFRTPGMRYDIPEFENARINGAQITSEMELFISLCPCEIFGITGSDGKTTTTTLVYLILKEAGYKCWLGGNIGTPLIDKIEEISENDKVILELSSFQLHTLKQSANVSIVTNISPNHLDYHTSMDEYIEAKKNIYLYQKKSDKVILNYDNDITRELTAETIGECVLFSRVSNIVSGILVNGNDIVDRKNGTETKIMEVSDIILPGVHNVENYLAAIAATIDYVKPSDIINVAGTFKGVEHRIEFVREVNGIKFYNDSIGTSPTRTTASINSFKQKVILIAGGYDKKIPFDNLGKVVAERVKKLFLIGKTTDKIDASVKAVDSDFPVKKCLDLNDAVNEAYKAAKEGDIIILSPACASFDMFKSFEQRGNIFKEIVNGLK